MAKPECSDLAIKLIKIYAVSDALTHGWEYLEPERRAESLGRLKKRVTDLLEEKQIGAKTVSEVMDCLKTLESYNAGEGTIHNVPGVLLPAVADMVVDSILDCGCKEGGVRVAR